MASNEGHIHWDGSADSTVNFLDQELQLLSEKTNLIMEKTDPEGAIRIRLNGSVSPGLLLPSEDWQVVPGTSPALEARQDGHYPQDYIRIRLA